MTDWHGLHAVKCPGAKPSGRPCENPLLWSPLRACGILLGGPADAKGDAPVCHCRRCNAWVEIRRAA